MPLFSFPQFDRYCPAFIRVSIVRASFIKAAVIVFVFCISIFGSPAAYLFGSQTNTLPDIDRTRLSGITDDSPLARSSDKSGWDYLFGILRNCSEKDIENADAISTAIPAGFLEMNRQPVEYRGRWIRITGKLLRCEFIPVKPDDSPFAVENNKDGKVQKQAGFYQSWIVLPDRKDIPVCVCSLEIPDGVDTEGNDITLPVSVSGIFYKRLLYLSDGDEEVHTPLILAKNINVLEFPKPEQAEKATAGRKYSWDTYLFSSVGLLVALWILLRTRSKKVRKNSSETGIIEPLHDENKTVANSSDDTQNLPPSKARFWFIPLFILSGIFGTSSQLYGEEDVVAEGKIDAEFTRTQLLQTDEYTWDALGDEKVPLEQQRDLVLTLLERLTHSVPASFLRENIAVTFPGSKENPPLYLTEDPAQYRGKVFRLNGTLTSAEIIPLNPAEQKALEIPAIYRCRINVSINNPVEVWTAFTPESLCKKEKINANTQEKVAITGIFIKRINRENKEAPLTPVLSGDAPHIPVLVAPRLEWFPNNYLGSLGMDFGTFEQVPVLKTADIKEKELKNIPFSLSLLNRKELIRRAFKFTTADKEPFYGMLKAVSKTPQGRIEQEARRELQKESKEQSRSPAVPLFNRPAEMQGKPVLLTGTARRVLPTLVEDEEVKKIYGIDKYYQIYLFTEDSQNNPLVICTTSLPKDMPTGSAPDYAEIISVGAFPYKLWVYESSEKLEDSGKTGEKHPESYKPSYAPMLIGRCPIWHSKPKDAAAKTDAKKFGSGLPDEVKTGFTVVLFVALFGIWIFMRRLKSFKPDKTIEFKLRK
jgi:hypothetical protein